MAKPLPDDRHLIVATVRRFVEKEVKPVAAALEHDQLRLADMATAITTARLLVHRAASALDAGHAGELESRMAKLHATETAYQVSLEAMRIHGGYGYTTEFLIERYYRDAPHLMLALGGNERERQDLAHHLTSCLTGSLV